MKVCLIVLASICAVWGAPSRTDLKALSDDMVNYINGLETTWKAGHSKRFQGVSMPVIRKMMGVLESGDIVLPIETNEHINDPIPEEFDARTQWPNCPTISEIRDQSNCGSCWAFGAVESMSDRICIASKGNQKPRISATDVLACCNRCGMGCNGGYLKQTWKYWVSSGLVTGGTYAQKDGCEPYPFPECEHHINGSLPSCSSEESFATPKCEKKCQASYPTDYNKDKHFGAKAYTVSKDQKAIQKEIMTNGPVEASYSVFEDFLSYKSGVYQHTTGSKLGGHAVRMLGWGVENGTPYWLIANSWNSDWGDKGFFKILRGKNEAGIEGNINTGTPKL